LAISASSHKPIMWWDCTVHSSITESTRTKLRSWGVDFLLKNDTLQCGLNLQKALSFLQDIGVQKEFDAAILTTTHFYNMALKNGFLPKDTLWVDLEYFIEKQGVHYTFVGDRHSAREECATRYSLATGMSAKYFARTNRSGIKTTALEMNDTKATSPRRQLYYLSSYARSIWGKSVGLVERHNATFQEASGRPAVMLEKMVKFWLEKSETRSETSSSTYEMTPMQMLVAFKKAMVYDASCRGSTQSPSLSDALNSWTSSKS
jgi:hypothetical protein